MEHGIITAVEYEQGVVTCNVQAIRGSNEYRGVPVLKPFGGMYRTPKPGQKVAMEHLDDGTRFITGFITRDSSNSYPDDMDDEELVFQVDDETYFQFDKQSDGTYNIEMNASGAVNIDSLNVEDIYSDDDAVAAVNAETSLDVSITGDAGTLDGNEASAFATVDHLHDDRYVLEDDAYSDSDAVSAVNNDTDHGSTASHDYFSGSYGDLSNREHGASDHDGTVPTSSEFDSHVGDTTNPHSVTASQVDALSTSGGTVNGDLEITNGNLDMGGNSVTTTNFEIVENNDTNSLDFNYIG